MWEKSQEGIGIGVGSGKCGYEVLKFDLGNDEAASGSGARMSEGVEMSGGFACGRKQK
jgi:hypothetical protein